MKKKLIPLLAALLLAGCRIKQLKTPAQDHYVQAQTIANDCREHGTLGEGVCTQEMLDHMAKQAECIHAITESRKCDGEP